MTRESRAGRIRRLTDKAVERYAQARAETARRRDRAPRAGDIYADAAGFPVEWVVLDRDPEVRQHLLAVAADLNPLTGRADVAVAAEAPSGPLCLRCRFAIRLDASDLDPRDLTGFVAPGDLERARHKRAELATGAAGSLAEQETDGDPEYLGWVEDVLEKAHDSLTGALARRRTGTGATLHAPPEAMKEPARARARSRAESLYRLAASILLLVTLGLLAATVAQHREIEALKRDRERAAATHRSLVNLPLVLFGPAGRVRGQVETLAAHRTASHLLLLFEVNALYPAYRLEIASRGARAPAFSSDGLRRLPSGQLTVVVPRDLLAPGEYELRLHGLVDGEADLVAEYGLRLEGE